MEFGYEERSKRLIERLDRIQNYLQSLPPLPKVESVGRIEGQSRDLNEISFQSACTQTGSESAGSAGSSVTKRSVSTRLSKTIPKDERATELLQQALSVGPSPSTSKASSGGPSPAHSNTEFTKMKNKKKRHKDSRIRDPLKPTTRTSFGVDIGQGINVINYIKQNAVLGSDAKNNRLAGIITKTTGWGVNSDKSWERVHKQGPSSGETSRTSIQLKNKDSAVSKYKPSGGHKEMGFGSTVVVSRCPDTSDSDIYRVRYHKMAVELPHHHGLDSLQELFVPYMEHAYPDGTLSRNESDYE